MTTATLTILRHGQTDYNALGLMTGHFDAKLTETGLEQARSAGKMMAGMVFDKAYSSTLSRAFNTAALVLEHSNSNSHLKNADGSWKIEQRFEVIERHHGSFTGRCKNTDPEIMAFVWGPDTAAPGGESENQVIARVKVFFAQEVLPRLKRGENVLIVCHAGIVRCFDAVLDVANVPGCDANIRKASIGNAAPTIFQFEDGQLKTMRRIANDIKPPAPHL